MALQLGGSKLKIRSKNVICNLHVYVSNNSGTVTPVPTNALLSSDRLILKDSRGIYLIPSTNESISYTNLLTMDSEFLQDIDGLDLVF